MKATGGLYLHVPYCHQKCLYCDFYTAGSRIADWPLYTQSVINELRERQSEITYNLDTLYIGGGTPSLMPKTQFKQLLNTLNDILNKKLWKEFTLEVNPEDVDEERIKIWKDSGVNRISMGIQSMNDAELRGIGRVHTGQQAKEAYWQLRKHFENISLDIIYGLPGQTLETLKNTVEEILSLMPDHVSVYSLMLEKGTALTHLVEKKRVQLPTEQEWYEMNLIIQDILEGGGYQRYEISNYSLQGKESRHNQSYWEGKPYLGLGPGAHSYDGENTRRYNPTDLKGFLSRFGEEEKEGEIFYEEEILNETELREEMVMTRLRTVKGLDLNEFEKKFGDEETKKLRERALRYKSSCHLTEKEGFLSVTDKGFLISDSIIVDLI